MSDAISGSREGRALGRFPPLLLLLLPAAELSALVLPLGALRVVFSDLFQVLASLVAFVLLLLLALSLRSAKARIWKAWSIIAAGGLLFALGMLAFMVVELGSPAPPYPGLPDLFFLSSYPLMMVGVLAFPRAKLEAGEIPDLVLELGALVIASLMLVWNYSLFDVVQGIATSPNPGLVVSFTYGVLDVLLLFVLFYILLRRVPHEASATPLLLMIVGGYFLILADLSQAWISAHANFRSGSPADLGWVLFSSLLGLAALTQLKGSRAAATAREERRRSLVGRMIRARIATIWLVAVILLLVWSTFVPVKIEPKAEAIGTALVIALVIVRQLRAVTGNEWLAERLLSSNEELGAALENLRRTQRKLIDSANMVSFGLLSAEMAHSLNTPLGAIGSASASLGELVTAYPASFRATVEALTEGEREVFLRVERSIVFDEESALALPSRKLAKELEARLARRPATPVSEARLLPDVNAIAATLVEMGRREIDEELATLVASPKAELIFETLSKRASIARLLLVISGAEAKAAAVVQDLMAQVDPEKARGREPIDLLLQLETVLQTLPIAVRGEIKLTRDYDRVPLVACDGNRSGQVWMNVIQNACEAMEGKGTLTLTVREEEARVFVAIRDTGPGIPPGIRDRIFDPFFTTRASHGHSGLGLNIAKAIVVGAGGDLSFETSEEGTVFTISFPEWKEEPRPV